MRKKLLISLAFLAAIGCSTLQPAAKDSIPEAQQGSARVQENIKAVEREINAAKPESSPVGRAHLDSALSSSSAANKAADDVDNALQAAESERAGILAKLDAVTKERDELHNSWGHRLQVWVTKLAILLSILVAFHFLGGIAAIFIPGPIGAGLAFASQAVNPFGWFASARDNLYFRYKAKAR